MAGLPEAVLGSAKAGARSSRSDAVAGPKGLSLMPLGDGKDRERLRPKLDEGLGPGVLADSRG